MLMTRYIAIVAIFFHCLLCGNVNCCAMTCSADDTTSCPCHSGKHDAGIEDEKSGDDESDHNHHCDHQHHFCQCVQSPPPKSDTGFRMILSQNLQSHPTVFLPATSLTPSQVLFHRTSETVNDSSAPEVRLHLLLEHFLI